VLTNVGSRTLFVLTTAAILVAAIVLELVPYTITTQAASDWLQVVVIVAALWSTLRTAVRESGEGRWVWLGVAASIALWGAGQVRYILVGSSFFNGIDTLQNVLFLSVALPLLPALALHPDDSHSSRTRLAFDVGIVGVLVVFVYVYIGLSFPAMTDPAAYPRWRIGAGWFTSLAVTGAFLLRLRTAVAPWRRLYAELGGAAAFWFLGDAAVTGVMFANWYRPGLLDLPWLLPFAWITLIAARWQPSSPSPVTSRSTGWTDTRRGAILALAAVAAPPLLHFTLMLGEPSDPAAWRNRTWAVLLTSTVVAGLFLMRQLSVLKAFERSERLRLAQRRSSEERFTRAFHGVPLGAAILSEADARVIDANDRALELLGLSRGGAIGQTLEALDVVAQPGSWLDAVRQTSIGRGRSVRLRPAGGEVVEVQVWFQPLETDGERTVLVLLQDRRETRRLETQLILAQKAEAVGRLAGAVAHDLNNLLTAIVGSTEVARLRLSEPAVLRQDLEHVVGAAGRAASLTSRLLEYGRGQAESPQTIDVGEAVRDAERTVRQLAGDGVTTELEVPPVMLQVRMEPAEFERILVNLVVNARDAMPGGGRLQIALRPVTIDAPAASRHGVTPGQFVALAVGDTGEGIDPMLLPRVFEPFFTTKPAEHGSGLGLSTVLDTARRFGGTAAIESTPGVGTTVTVLLPAVDEAWVTEPAPEVSSAPPLGTETVLLVEDEDAVREVVRRVLERQGYRVLEASSGPRALALAATWIGAIDLLLTDVIMPEMNGPQLAAQLSALRPGLRVLYASGYAADALGPMGLETREVDLIQKPFSPGALARRVRQALDEPR
jgi:two-component system cell cycle sensor histidine kinase/response regulator CckA